jgi:hypothetical protein
MKTTRFLAPAGLALLAAASTSCAYYFPHSVVATNIRTTDRDSLVSGSKRVEAEVCGNRVLWIPFGPDPRTTTVMAALQDQVTNAVGFEDIRMDVSVVNYVYPIFWQECVQASAFPLIPVTKAHAGKNAGKAAPSAEPAAPANESAPAPNGETQPADPFAN